MKVCLNLNSRVKVKLTDHGKDVYYHQYDDLKMIKPKYPEISNDGYFEDHLWQIMQTFGPNIGMGFDNVFENVEILIDDKDLTEMKNA